MSAAVDVTAALNETARTLAESQTQVARVTADAVQQIAQVHALGQ